MTSENVPSLSSALTEALTSVPLRPEDSATVQLAREYSSQIDTDPDVAVKLGPLLLAVLVELGMTPRARASVLKGAGNVAGGRSAALDELRQRRDRRVGRAAAVDAAPS